MKDTFNKIFAWAKDNMLIAVGILIAVVILFFPKVLRGITGTRRVRHRRLTALPYRRRRSVRRPLPRSVGMHKTRKQYFKGGKAKKPWQIKGSEAARRHMRRIRALR